MQNERKIVELNIADVLPNRFQPRIKFDENAINELALSIQKYGVIQPIVVRQIGNKYEIIAGERRYKASKVAGKKTIPAIISDLSDKDSVEIALIENVQREDLTPIEKAVSYKKILDMGYINQEELAKKVGKSQSSIANTLRLLNLSDDVQEALLENKISERHARSLLKITDEKKQVEMLNRIINERLTVRKTDEEIDKMLNEKNTNEQFEYDKPEEIVKIPDTAMNAPGFMNIDLIENNAKDIVTPEKPVADMDKLLQDNKSEQPKQEESTNKFFNFFDEPTEQPKQENSFKLENLFNNADNSQSLNVTPSAPTMDTLSIPEAPVMPSASTFDTPSIPEAPVMPSASTFDTPSIPEVPIMPSAPAMDTPSIPEAPVMPSAPAMDTPSIPEAPVMPSVQDISSTPEISPSFTTSYETPVSSNSNEVPIIDSPIEPSLNIGNTNVEMFHEPTSNNNVQANIKQAKISIPNMKIALNTIRECQNTLEKYGFVIDVEEIDFEDSYQVIFKIQK